MPTGRQRADNFQEPALPCAQCSSRRVRGRILKGGNELASGSPLSARAKMLSCPAPRILPFLLCADGKHAVRKIEGVFARHIAFGICLHHRFLLFLSTLHETAAGDRFTTCVPASRANSSTSSFSRSTLRALRITPPKEA